jgi:hypothetical protein
MIDYFQYPHLIPKKIKAILDREEAEGREEFTYIDLLKLCDELELLGWTFDFGLDCIPFNLRLKDKVIVAKPKKVKKPKPRGGVRPGAGPKAKYTEEAIVISFRCPISKADELKLMVKSKLKEYEKFI